jgi:hypothetical protein
MRAIFKTSLTDLAFFTATVALMLSVGAHRVQAAGPNLGVTLITTPQGLFVRQQTSPTPFANLHFADQITSVNGRRVDTEAAFMAQLMKSNGSATLTVLRGGRVQTLGVRPVARGIINPADIVMTSQGAMHKDAARRLGLSGTPISGTPEPNYAY